MKTPLVSIIIPSYNRESIIKETLESVLLQSYSNWECIVVDDLSNDSTVQIVKSYSNIDSRFIHYLRPEDKPKGPSSCRNYGVTKANGKYLIFLDSDDLLAPSCIERRVAKFLENPNCDFLVFQMERFEIQPDYLKKVKKFEDNKNTILASFISLHGQWPITSPIYRTSFFKNKIGFNERLKVFEDLEVAIYSIVFANCFLIFENIDCFYRNDINYKEKYNSLEVKTKMLENFQIFIESLSKLIANNPEQRFKNKDIKNHLVASYKKVFHFYILENSKIFKKYNISLLKQLRSREYLATGEVFEFYFVDLILLPFAHIKGLGIYRFIKFIYK